MHAVVTGAAGFIGGHLAAELLARDYRVTAIDRQPDPGLGTHRYVALDLAEPNEVTDVEEVMRTADVVFHLAGRPGVRDRGRRISDLRRRDNVVATDNVLSAAPVKAHVVTTSSSSVYGGASMSDGILRPSRETDPVRPLGGYAISKVRMEKLCAQHRARGRSVTVVRPFTVAGEKQRSDMAFAIWLGALRRGDPIVLFGSGERSRDITDVRDVVEGLIRAAESRVDTTVNLGTGVGHRLFDMALALIDVVGGDGEVIHAPVVTEDVSATLADTTRCQSLLGFVPSTDLPAVLERLTSTRAQPALSMR